MTMTNEEIVRHYNEAKNKSKDIKVLADLNCCSPSEIRAVLAQAGLAGIKAPQRIAKRKTDHQAVPLPAAPDPVELRSVTVYDRIETILDAVPADASACMRDHTLNLVIAMLSDYVERRLRTGGTA